MDLDVLSQELAGVDPSVLLFGGAALGIVAMILAFGGILWYFLSALGYYKMYKKAGKRGWMAFVPVVRSYARFSFAWNIKAFWLYLVCLAVMQFVGSSEQIVLSLLALACSITVLVLSIKLDIRVAKSFGKSAGVGVLLFFFPFIVSLILGFGKAKYVGNTTVAAAAAEETVAEEKAAE